MIRVARRTVPTVAIVIALLALSVVCLADESPADRIAQADAAYSMRYVEEQMVDAIALYEAVVPDLPELTVQSQAYVLNRLSQLYYEATLFSEGDTPVDERLFERGKEYGFQSLRLNPQFAEAEARNLTEAVSYVTDAAALHWTVSNFGKLGDIDPLSGLLNQGKILALFRRAVEVDPTFWGSSSRSSLGSLLILSPGPMGGNDAEGLALIEASIADAPTYLSNRIILAEYWGFTYNYFGQLEGIRDAELIEREVAFILAAEIGEWPFWNRMAKLQAEVLLERLESLR
jgi:hypothetical protein